MNIFTTIAVGIIVIVTALSAGDLPIFGTVTAPGGASLPRARLWFLNNRATARSDGAGEFQFGEITDTRHPVPVQAAALPALRNNHVCFTIEQSDLVRIFLFDGAGRCVGKLVDEVLSPRRYRCRLPLGRLSPSVYIVTLQAGNRHYCWKYLLPDRTHFAAITTARQHAVGPEIEYSPVAKKHATTIDTLVCQAAGYYPAFREVSGYSGRYNFTLTGNDTTGISFTTPEIAARSFPQYDSAGRFSTWLGSIATNGTAPGDSFTLYSPRHSIDINTPCHLSPVTFLAVNNAAGVTKTVVVYAAIYRQYDFPELSAASNSDLRPPEVVVPDTLIRLRTGDTFIGPAAQAIDDRDGDISNGMVTSGIVNTAIPGTYKVTYYADDSFGLIGRATVTVVVEE